MNVEYCQICKTRLSERDFDSEKAFWMDKRPYCRSCAVGKDAKIAAPAAVASIPGKQPSSGFRPKIQTHADFIESLESMPGRPGSGLNKAPGSGLNKAPGSGLNKSPGSGLNKATVNKPASGSGILKASTTKPGSGIMMAHGTSLSPGSGLNKPVGSGIRAATNAAPGKTSGLHKSTGSGIRTASPAGTPKASGTQRSTTVRPPSGGNKGKPEGSGSGSGAPRAGARRRLNIRNPDTGKFSWLPVLGCLIAIGIVIELILLMRR